MRKKKNIVTRIKLDEIEVIRVFSISYIILFHSFNQVSPYFYKNPFIYTIQQVSSFHTLLYYLLPLLANSGVIAVWVFIILSGFSLFIGYQNIENNIEFYKKRLTRLIIPFYNVIPLVLLAHFLIVNLIADPANIHLSMPAQFIWSFGGNITLGTVLMTYLFPFIFDISMSFMGLINGSWWFLPLIIELYVVYPFILKLIKKYGMNVTFLMAGLLNILYLVFCIFVLNLGISGSNPITALFPTFILCFVFGIFLADLYRRKPKVFDKVVSIPAFVFYTILFLFLLQFNAVNWVYVLYYSIQAIFLFLSFFSVARILKRSTRMRSILNEAGKRSYSMYLVHQPFIPLWVGLFAPHISKRVQSPFFGSLLVMFLCLIMSYVLSLISERLRISERFFTGIKRIWLLIDRHLMRLNHIYR